ncbi:HAD family hydrolase [Hymenobacter weizhouensis]|uniref:HAD family hydrolase n=1 Tax=Hymenobacter sp. YIM 151500-1 TaxID=2987689 RepID=UPI0022279BB8|nr:HAD family hydrolase [Hymenobacter sp. YIM 151500-1]UYZ61825.1 HAD family hydrolase [Hymenobacter sp. YIM 151500-1]
MPLTTVLFDLDDTLFDHTATARAALHASTAHLAFVAEVGLDELYRRYSELLEEMHPRVLAGELSYHDARRLRFQQLLAPYGVLGSDAAAEEFAALHYDQYRRLRRPVPGAGALLDALKPRYRTGIVTNNRTAEQQDKLQFLGLTQLVDVLITSEDVGATKPDPHIFQVALEQLGAQPDEAVFVGDNWVADVVGARNAGIRPVWLNRFGLACPDAAVAVLTGLEPLPDVLCVIEVTTP